MNINIEKLSTFIKDVHGSDRKRLFQYGVVQLPSQLNRTEEIQKAKDTGHHAGMAFTFSKPENSGKANKYDWANSAIVVAYNYMETSSYETVTKPGYSRIAAFSTEDHYEPLRKELNLIVNALNEQGHQCKSFADESFHYDRLFFAEAGLGWQGKSTMMLSPGVGPWQLIGTIYTSKEFKPSEKTHQNCGDCNYCQVSCPTGALNEDYVLNANLCIAYWLQSPNIIPRDMRVLIGNRLYGCDECLVSCPPGQREVRFNTGRNNVNTIKFLEKNDEDILKQYNRFYIPKMDVSYLKRNALIALANNPSKDAANLFSKYLTNSNSELVMYSIWSMWRISRVDLIKDLSHKVDTNDKIVQKEIEWALGMPS